MATAVIEVSAAPGESVSFLEPSDAGLPVVFVGAGWGVLS